jgi:glycosyltransferase involved in cell wall biosynthesis
MGPFPFDIPLFIKSGVLTRYLVEPLVNASRVVAVSNYLANKIMSFNITRNIDIIPNIILQKDLMSSKSTNERVTFICVANLIREKGIIELLNAVKLLSLKKLEFTVQILGSGVLYDEIYHFIKVHSLQFIVYLLGSKTNNEVLEMISNADIFVLPSYQETFGVVYAEAISLGKPVIATKCGGPEDIINEINGVFCDIGDSSDLAKKMEYMYYNYQSYDAFKIKNSFMDKFSSSKICNKIFKVYNEVINQCVE